VGCVARYLVAAVAGVHGLLQLCFLMIFQAPIGQLV
jgi:hypothetical protein